MADDERTKILLKLDDHWKIQEAAMTKIHEEQNKRLDDISAKLTPIYEIYSQFSGTGNLLMSILKYFIGPITAVLVMIYYVKKLL